MDAGDLPQYSLSQLLAVWAAATVPMGVLGWVVAPWAGHHLGGRAWWWLLPFLVLPRMRAVFGKADVIASSAAYTLYHLHQPWSMPVSFIDGVINLAYPTRRFESTWMGLIVHTARSLLIVGAGLSLVL